jgi:hypothetical protein
MLTWFLWGFFMGLGFAAAYGLMRASIVLWHLDFATYHRKHGVKAQPKRKGPRWEYHVSLVENMNLGMANLLGEDGWEFCAIMGNEAMFKRSLL